MFAFALTSRKEAAVPNSHTIVRSVDAHAERYARSRTERLLPVSMAHALQTLRTVMPDCDWPDNQLINLVAAKVVNRGHAVYFDAIRPVAVPDVPRVVSHDVVALLPDLRTRAYALVGQRDLADTIVEEALRLAIRRVASLDDKTDLADWLTDILNEAASERLPS